MGVSGSSKYGPYKRGGQSFRKGPTMTNKIDKVAIVDRLNQIQQRIYVARESGENGNFAYQSGMYDGYREALAALGMRVVYDERNTIVGVARK